MRKVILQSLFAVFLVLPPVPAWASTQVDPSRWVPQEGDIAIVLVDSDELYLLHKDSSFYVHVPVATGQLRYVRYIGRTYFAKTPLREWVMKGEMETKWDRTTFGEKGRFARLHWKGEKTPYGFHHYKYFDDVMQREVRKESMGCVLLSDEMMDVMQAYLDEGLELKVVTTEGTARIVEEMAKREAEENHLW